MKAYNVFIRLTLTIITLLVISSCKARLDADFEADTIGYAPNTYPASPQADSVSVEGFGLGSVVVTNSGALSGNKSMRINGPGGNQREGSYFDIVYFYAEPLEYEESIYANWQGLISSGVEIEFTLSNSHFIPLVNIALRNNRFYVNNVNSGTYTPGQEHLIFVTVSRDGRFSASISGSDAEGSVSNRALLSPLSSTSVQLSAYLLGGTSSSYYIMDEVNISEGEPDE